MPADIPLERLHDLADIPEAGFETRIVASPDELKRLAVWAGVEEVLSLSADVRVRPQSRTRFLLETEFAADIVQSCVVTLAPIRSHIERQFSRDLHLSPRVPGPESKGGQVSPESADDAPDEIESTRYDLAGPLREELALAIDPYPRAPGVEFEAPGDPDDRRDSPFAVLEKLRQAR